MSFFRTDLLKKRLSPRAWFKLSTVVAVLTISLKTGAFCLTDSVGLLSDALESFVNLCTALFAWAMLVIVDRPPDQGHPYGHYKAEYFASGFEGLLILGAAVGIGLAAIERWLNPHLLSHMSLGLVLSGLSAVLNGVLAYGLARAGRIYQSVALQAEAKHLLSDVWTSLAVIGGLMACTVTGWMGIDPLLAFLVSIYIFYSGWAVFWEAVQGLMDQALPDAQVTQISGLLREFEEAYMKDLLRFDHLSTRRAGQCAFADFHMHVPSSWRLGQAASVRAEVEKALRGQWPELRTNIQMLPFDVEPLSLLSWDTRS